MPELRLITLGGLALTRSGKSVTGPASQRTRLALLSLLAAAGERGVSRDKILGFFWPSSSAEHARGSLKQCVYMLRHELEVDDLIVGTSDLRLNRNVISADVTEFQEHAARGRPDQAMDLYAGPFLDGIYLRDAADFERWASEERARLSNLAAELAKGLAIAATASGRHALAAKWWQRLLSLDPFNATAAAGAIESLARSDQPTAALAQFTAYTDHLHKELGKSPDRFVMDAVALVGAPVKRTTETPGPGSGTSRPPTRQRSRSPLIWFSLGLPAIVTVSLVMSAGNTPKAADKRVVVARFANRTGAPVLDHVGFIAADRITDELSRSGLVQVTDPATALRALRIVEQDTNAGTRRSDLQQVAAMTGADVVVSGAYYQKGDSIQIVARVTASGDERVIGSADPVSVHVSDVMRGVEIIRQRVLGILAKQFDPRLARFQDPFATPTYEGYREYAIGYDLWLSGDYEGAVRHLKKAYDVDTTFVTPLFHAALTYNWWAHHAGSTLDKAKKDSSDVLITRIARFRHRLSPLDRHALETMEAAQRRDLGAWFRALTAASELSPGSDWTWLAANESGALNRPSLSLTYLKKVNPEGRADRWTPYWVRTIRVHHLLGNLRGEARAIELFARRAQRDNMLRQYNARILALRGQFDRVPSLIDEMLMSGEPRTVERVRAVVVDLERHGMHKEALSLLPRILDWYQTAGVPQNESSRRWMAFMLNDVGQDSAALAQFTSLLAGPHDSAHTVNYAGMMGVLSAKRGDKAMAVAISESIARLPVLWNGANTYWRARIAAQLDRKQEAVELLRQAFAEGWLQVDFDHTQRPNFPKLHGYAPFEALVRSDRPFAAGVGY